MIERNKLVPPKGLLENKTILVTGAGRGIGAETSKFMSKCGANVVLVSRTLEPLKETSEHILRHGGNALYIQGSVNDHEFMESAVERAVEQYGELNGAFNNAGSGHMPAPLGELSLEQFHESISVNLTGTFLSMKSEIKVMEKIGGGSIVNMSSTAGLQGVMGMSFYSASKHGVIGLTKSGALDYARKGIRVNAVAPGPIDTGHIVDQNARRGVEYSVPKGRMGYSEEVSSVVAWLCSDLSSFVTGETVLIDGGRLAGVWFKGADRESAGMKDPEELLKKEGKLSP